jgi:hypothetical protein
MVKVINMADLGYILGADNPEKLAIANGLAITLGNEYKAPMDWVEGYIIHHHPSQVALMRQRLKDVGDDAEEVPLEEILNKSPANASIDAKVSAHHWINPLRGTSKAVHRGPHTQYYETLTWNEGLNRDEIFEVYRKHLNNPERISKGMTVYKIFNILLNRGPSTPEEIMADFQNRDFAGRTHEAKLANFEKFIGSVSAPPVDFFVRTPSGKYDINYLKYGHMNH